jgi:hypothetical protein
MKVNAMRVHELDWTRQHDLIPQEKLQFPITLIGAGGINSPTALALAKMGCDDITVYDFDAVDDVNIANQFYPLSSVGKPKVEALALVLEEFAGVKPQIICGPFTGEERLKGCIISGVDTMKARMTIWRAVRYKPAISLYIDARLGAEIGMIYSIRPCDIDEVRFYEETLHSEEESFEALCTARATIYSPLFMAALITNQVKKHALEETLCREIIFDLKNVTLLASQGALGGTSL